MPGERSTVGESRAGDDARIFRAVVIATAVIVTVIMPVVALVEHDAAVRALRNIVVVDGMTLVVLWLAGRGRLRVASWSYVAAIVALITYNALPVGGIRSPGVQSYFLLAMMAGLLLGESAGVIVAAACAALGLGLVVAERLGMLPPHAAEYNAVVRWLLSCLYMTVALLLMRVATRRVRNALADRERELAVRRATETRLDRALEAGRIGIFERHLGGDSVRIDARMVALTGLTVDEDGRLPLAAWMERVHPEDRDRMAREMAQVGDPAMQRRLQYRFVRPDGEVRDFETASDATATAPGEPPSVFGMITDVTERRRTEAERERLVLHLGERIKELRLLHEASRLLQQSGGVDRLLLAELAARMPAAWLHADDACARVAFGMVEATSPGWAPTPWVQTATFTTNDGEGVLQLAYRHEHPAADEGPFLTEERALIDSLAEMLRTHVERFAAERQRQAAESQLRQAQKMEALGTLAGGIAHDFNNILAAIGGNAELAALDAPPGGPVEERIAEILRANARARDLVRRILLFGRRQESSRQMIALAPVVDEALELLRATLPRNVEIRPRVAPGLPPARADATQVHQVMMNLGTNAVYAMREHGGVLSVALDAVTVESDAHALSSPLAPGRWVRLTVSDTGSGMSPEARERLFEPFFTTKGLAGTGLGLSVVHGIVRDHGGTITVSSEPGAGTEFVVHLPAEAGGTVAAPDATAGGVAHGDGQHVMYVDDEADVSHLMTRVLVRLGYRCTSFTDPVVALHEFRAAPHAFDAVISDLQMPSMSGLDLARAVRAVRPEMPFAVASGYAATHIDTDPDARSVAWISKPLSLADLAPSLHRLVRGGDGGDEALRARSRGPL